MRLIEDALERVDFRNLLPSVFAFHENLDVIPDGTVFDKLRDFPGGVGALRLGADREIQRLTVVGRLRGLRLGSLQLIQKFTERQAVAGGQFHDV